MSDDGEPWKPEVLARWDALLSSLETLPPWSCGTRYTAFLRYVFKRYNIEAKVGAPWVKSKRGGKHHRQLKVTCLRRTRTMEETREDMDELRDIICRFAPERCDVAPPPALAIHYNPMNIWEKDWWNSRHYFRDVMSVGKGSVPYLPSDLREIILADMPLC